ncbi:Clathrin assembly protein [Melia azedarach]|uniref:Clathrin assembly protein n=1 Tax=Melia azedarach TaxID=155640 RepID=A0ACC1XFL9_MELAZ|nr:Clathrin assembly protein [Melia azedarach]
MKLWQRATGALKDKNSIWAASLSRRNSYRNPDLEAAIIKATSHDELHVDYRNAQRVFAWIRTSQASLKPLVCALSKRMEKTKSWVVALKGLILMHGVFCCKIPAVQKIGRLPFDLSGFSDGHSRPSLMWGFNNFIRSYYAFLDQRSAFLYEQSKHNETPMVQELLKLQKLQGLLDLLLQIKPTSKSMRVALILEAMDCIIIEVYDIYSRICSGIARVLLGIYGAERYQIEMALSVLQKATEHSEQLSVFLQFCKDFGVMNMLELPKATQIPEEGIRDLERMINEISENDKKEDSEKKLGQKENPDNVQEDKALIQVTDQEEEKLHQDLKTIITDKWEVFDEDIKANGNGNGETNHLTNGRNPFSDSPNLLPLVPACKNDLPDLICF